MTHRDGELNPRQRLAYARHAMLVQLTHWTGQAGARLRQDRLERTALVSGRNPPDSRLARQMLEQAREAYGPPLLGHCLRCWLWADLFAQLDGISYDPELLYVSCLLHDLGLTDAHRPAAGDHVGCFAVHGGRVARLLLVQEGAAPAFADLADEAIALHMDVQVPLSSGAEAHLLHAAAHLDVAGIRAAELPPPAVQQVLGLHPRDGFPAEFGRLMRREAAERPASRAALGWRLGMRLPLTHNPIDRPSLTGP